MDHGKGENSHLKQFTKRGGPQHDHCTLCNGPLETCIHLVLLCPFAKALWSLTLTWEHFNANLILPMGVPTHPSLWWEEAQAKISKNDRSQFNGVVSYVEVYNWIAYLLPKA
jgi:hypothetical protein